MEVDERPYVPATTTLPEITVKAMVLGVLLSALLAAANAYLGLKVGLTVSASIPAAVLSMAILRLFRNSNILENNIVQTAASAGESLAAGVIFTFPALLLMGYWSGFEFGPMLALSSIGGVLGVLFTVPLRRALVIEAKLQFPEGVATGEVLKAGEEGDGGARLIAIAGIAGALFKLGQSGLKVVAGAVSSSVTVGRSVFGMGSDLGVALLAVGYIVGLNIAVLVLAGGLISWLFGIPIYMAVAPADELAAMVGEREGYEAALAVWSKKIRYLGVGAMATGGLWALVSLFGPIRDGIRSSLDAVRKARSGQARDIPRTERDTPILVVFWGTLLLAFPMFLAFTFVIDQDALGISTSTYAATIAFGVGFALVAGFLFASVAGYMAGLVGSSNNPISGVTIATILTISLILLALLGGEIDFQADDTKARIAAAVAILVGAVVCCAAAIAGDNMQDLKAGRIVGATPVKQQIMQVVGVLTAAVVIAPVLQLLFEAYGMGTVLPREGMNPAEALQAPQASLMQAVSEGVLKQDLPWGIIGIGALVAVGLIVLDTVLEARGSSFRTPVLAVAVGIYLPVELSVPIFVGGLVAHLASRALRARSEEERSSAERRGLLFASGLITGEALVGIALALPFALYQTTDVFTVPLPDSLASLPSVLGGLGFAGFGIWLYRIARSPE
ncbi:MAG: oligopeptide transporter, OPT family [Myxococcota bacterium]